MVTISIIIIIILSSCLMLLGILILIQIHLCCPRRNVRVELVMQLVNLLVQIVVVLFGIGQLLL
jgi:hypothetical protein